MASVMSTSIPRAWLLITLTKEEGYRVFDILDNDPPQGLEELLDEWAKAFPMKNTAEDEVPF